MIRVKTKTTARVLDDSGKVNIAIAVESVPTYGYGYGYNPVSGLDFFDIFGLEGEKLGYFLDPITTPFGYSYGFGYEYTENICSYDRTRTFTATVTKSDLSPAVGYTVKVYVKGQGFADDIIGTTDANGQFSFDVQDLDVHMDETSYFMHEELQILEDDAEEQYGDVFLNNSAGTTDLANRDSYLDILVEVVNTFADNQRIKLKARASDSTDVSGIKIKVIAKVVETA